jgi:hypothetical protein
MRLPHVLRQQDGEIGDESVTLRRALLWLVVGVAITVAIVLYFKYARFLVPLLG